MLTEESSEKITEITLYKKLAISIAIMLVCMFAMGLTAYAYFSTTVEAGQNEIVAAKYDLEITVDGALLTADTVTLTEGTHTVTMKKTIDSTATTGFCKIVRKVGNEEFVYFTQQIGTDVLNNTPAPEITFTINAPAEGATLSFIVSWGTSVYYGADNDLINNGETLNIQ